MRRLRVHALIACCLFTASTAADAGPQRRVGVVVTLEVGVEKSETRAIADALGAALRTTLPVDVISGAETDRRLPPEGLPEDCVGQPTCRNDLGRRLDADELLLIAVVAVGETVNVDATWADVASGRTASRPRVSLAPGADREARFAEVAQQYLPHIREPEEKGPNIVVVPTPVQRDSGRQINTPVLISGSVAIAAGITGGVLGLMVRNRHNECEQTQCSQSDLDGGKRLALFADIAFAAAAGAAITAGVFYYMSAPDEPDDRPSLTPTIGPNQVGVSLGGRF